MSAQKKKIIILVAALVVVAAMVGCWFAFGPKSGGAGQKEISVTVVADDVSEEFNIKTNAEFLRGALEEQKLVEGDESEFGLFVKTVNGRTVDDSKQEWWYFTKGGAEIMTGVDTTPIAQGDAFEITLKTGY